MIEPELAPLVPVPPLHPFTSRDVFAVTIGGPALLFPRADVAKAEVLRHDIVSEKLRLGRLWDSWRALEGQKGRSAKRMRDELRLRRIESEGFLVQAHRDLLELAVGYGWLGRSAIWQPLRGRTEGELLDAAQNGESVFP